jgi:signal transduction histidine kinase
MSHPGFTVGTKCLSLKGITMSFVREQAFGVQGPVSPLKLKNILRECVETVAPLAATQRVDLMLRHTPDVEVMANGRRVKHVLINLLSNAIKYNRKNGVVIVASKILEGQLRISVSDTGPGLKDEHVERLFTHYDQLDAIDTTIDGTGSGLARSKRFVEAMGGSIGVESVPGDGSTFWVEFPVFVDQWRRLAS